MRGRVKFNKWVKSRRRNEEASQWLVSLNSQRNALCLKRQEKKIGKKAEQTGANAANIQISSNSIIPCETTNLAGEFCELRACKSNYHANKL